MQKNNKIVIILLVVLISIAGYIAFFKGKSGSTDTVLDSAEYFSLNENNLTRDVWLDLKDGITLALNKDLPLQGYENDSRGTILRSDADVTGDGIPEALVLTGTGGAYTTEFVVMRTEDGNVVTANYMQQDGTIGPFTLSGGASVMNLLDYGMISSKQAVYQVEVQTNGDTGKVETCNLSVYKWNSQTKVFEYSSSLSNEQKVDVCSKIGPQG